MNPPIPDSMTLGNGAVVKYNFDSKALTIFTEGGQSVVLSHDQQRHLAEFMTGIALAQILTAAK
jgi:hypothetical protein